jgi:hypothetical protein
MTNLDWRVNSNYSQNKKNKSANGLRFEKWPLHRGLGVHAESSILDHNKLDRTPPIVDSLVWLVSPDVTSWDRTTCIWVGYAIV